VHSGLHIFFSEDEELRDAAARNGAEIVDIRKPPQRQLRMFSGAVKKLRVPRVVILGQDAAVGKRTACLRLGLELAKHLRPCMIGTGQTAWLQGFPYGVRLDSLPMDFSAGELEGQLLIAAERENPDLLLIEGQGALLNPGYGSETLTILHACQPSAIVYVAAPTRKRYVDFPTFRLSDPHDEIRLIERISEAPVVGVVLHGNLKSVGKFGVPTSVGVSGEMRQIAAAVENVIR